MYTLTAPSTARTRRDVGVPDAGLRFAAPGRYRSDFGRTIVADPRVVIRARSEAEAGAAMRTASSRGLPLTVRGAGHSCHGQSLSRDGLLLANEDDDASPIEWVGDGLVDVAGRAHWRRIERALNRRGWSVPVLPDYLDLSVGGTLSVGGYGIDSVRHGSQMDQVERLRVITANGDAAWCSPTERPELFGSALAGLGQAGIIERAVIRVVPHRPITTLAVTPHDSLEALVEWIGWMPTAVDRLPAMFKAVWARGRVTACYGTTSMSLGEARRMTPGPSGRPMRRYVVPQYRALRALSVKLWVARHGRARRVWSDYVLDYDGLVGLARFLRTQTRSDAFGGCLQSVYVLAIRRPPRAVALPFDAAGAIDDALGFGIGLYSMVPAGRPDLLRRVRRAASACLDRCLELGGRPYRYGCHDIDERMARAIYARKQG